MKKLDLHNRRHDEVERLTENFILLNDGPLLIITGYSDKMIEIVTSVCKTHQIKYEIKGGLGSHILITSIFMYI